MNNPEEYMEKFKLEYGFKLEQSTIKDIQIDMEQLLANSKKTIQDISARDIRNWLNHLYTKGYAQGSVRTKFFRIKRFFQYCLEEEFINYNPLQYMPIPDVKQKLPRYLTTDQLKQLRKLVSGQLKQRTVIEVLYVTGVRVSELCAMKKEDINWSERFIYVRGKGKKERIVLFTNECAEYLKAYLQGRNDDSTFLFLNSSEKGPIDRHTIGRWFKIYQKELCFKVSPHTLRHTFAAHLAIKGMPLVYIQGLLGHEEQRDTQIYARLCNHARKQMYDQWM
jgi:site-specific recombinase XerD